MASSVNQWLQDHPAVFRLVQMLLWASNHPLISFVIFIILFAISLSLIKALGRLFEILGLSILKAPFNLFLVLIGSTFKFLGTFGGFAFKRLGGVKNADPPVLEASNFQPIEMDKQQRITEISSRLEAISQEQNELLQELTTLIKTES